MGRKRKATDINDNTNSDKGKSPRKKKKRANSVRLGNSSVHKEFTTLDDETGLCKHCEKEVPSTASSYKKHLKHNHKEEHDRVEHQDKILLEIQIAEAEAKNSGRDLKESLVKMIFCTGIPVTIVQNKYFREFCESLYPGFPHTTLKGLWSTGENMKEEMFAEISRVMKEAKSVSLAVDAWTSFGSKSSYLGVSAQCYSFEKKKLVNYTLALKQLKQSHTGAYICDVLVNVCKKFDILEKVTSIAVDNASNMNVMIAKINDKVDSLMEMKVMLGGNPPDTNENEDATNDVFLPHSCDLRVITDEDEDNDDYDELEGIKNFLDETQSLVDLQNITASFASLKKVEKMRCFAHTLQLAITSSCSTDFYFYDILRKVRKIAVKFSKSEGPKQDLKSREVSLLPLRTVSTRWFSDFLATERIVDICDSEENRESLNCVIEKYSQKPKKKKKKKQFLDDEIDENLEDEEEIDLRVTLEDLKKMKEYIKVFQSFMDKSNMLGSQKKAVAHLVFPSVKELEYHLTSLKENWQLEGNDGLNNFVTILHENFQDKFKFMLDTSCEDYTPTYVTVTYLSPVHSCSLSENEVSIAKEYLKKLLNDRQRKEIDLNESLVGSPPANDNILISGFPFLSQCVQRKSVQQEECDSFDSIILSYIQGQEKELSKFKRDPSRETCPILYWGSRADEPLAEIALRQAINNISTLVLSLTLNKTSFHLLMASLVCFQCIQQV